VPGRRATGRARARTEEHTLTVLWGSEDTERVRTSCRLTAAGLEVTDEVMTKEGGWRVFGRSRLSRAP
jgi:hypothetical protein